MPKCPKCDKEVYFAEQVTSLGKDWHRPCLKCGKTLTSGGHAKHEGKPYCNHPCYSAMFGPKGFGRGGAEASVTFKSTASGTCSLPGVQILALTHIYCATFDKSLSPWFSLVVPKPWAVSY
uniref:Cysteine-rich protein 1 n=1 Tax=Microcebus murinus TaxID=30608 RepID=A0A8C5VH32_MICMU